MRKISLSCEIKSHLTFFLYSCLEIIGITGFLAKHLTKNAKNFTLIQINNNMYIFTICLLKLIYYMPLKLSLVLFHCIFCFTLNAFLNVMKLVLHWINVWIYWLSQMYMFAVDYFQAFHSICICTEVSIKSCAWLLLHVCLFRNWTDLCTTATVRTRRPCLSHIKPGCFYQLSLIK